MNIRVNHTIKTPIYRQIATQMRNQIFSGEIGSGSTLPSERAMAQMLGVHRNTVVRAYSELKDEALIESRQGVGYVVMLPAIEKTGGRGKRVHWESQIREKYLDMQMTFDDLFQRFSNENIISLGSGIATTEIYDKEKVAADLAGLLTAEGRNQYFYSPYQGDKNLRQKLISFLSTKGVKATLGEIQILTETNQALDFIVTLLLKQGEVVLMEEPVSPDVYRTVELAGGKIITVPVDRDGMQCHKLEELIQLHHPRFLYVNSSFHDPTGAILSMERRKRIIEISNRYRLAVIEEDAASELVYSGAKFLPIKAYDTLNNVIYIYSFSLTFMPGLSLAFVVADQTLIERLSYLVSVRLVSSDWLAQKLIARYLGDGSYYQVLTKFRENYALKQELICRKLDQMKIMGVEYERPRGGVYIWCKLPEGIDSKKLVDAAYQKGISILPGYVFYPMKNGGRDYIRLNYSYESSERLLLGMDILKDTIRKELAHKK
ncbi:MAG: PLP-dependent aminotransferase family protein [Firmicutes bacterium]|nr:PLP-dependent aminotransferase family protein [Bacillota bacterium]